MARITILGLVFLTSIWLISTDATLEGRGPEPAGPRQAAASGAGLAIDGAGFTIDGSPAFLTGVSLFDALGPTAPDDRDLDDLVRRRINAVRVWAHWSEAIYGADGALTQVGRSRLLALADRLERRRVVLELVVLRPGQLRGERFAVFAAPASRLRAARDIAEALKPHRLVLFDLFNEHDHPDGPISHTDARAIRDAVKSVDPQRVVTISGSGHEVIGPDGRVPPSGIAALREEVSTAPGGVGVDLVSPHLPRTADWAVATAARVKAIRAALDHIGSRVPIYLNEENRVRDGERPVTAAEFERAYASARASGAAGWVFHTAAGFTLRAKPFRDALLPVERDALERITSSVRASGR